MSSAPQSHEDAALRQATRKATRLRDKTGEIPVWVLVGYIVHHTPADIDELSDALAIANQAKHAATEQ